MPNALAFLLTLSVALLGGGQLSVSAAQFPPAVLEGAVSVLPIRNGEPAGGGHLEEPEGTGIAVFDGFFVATAAHVLTGAKEVHVRLSDGRVLPAQLVGQDRFTDIALLSTATRIPPFTLTPSAQSGIADGVSRRATVGMPVCSVGNQFGLGLSVTCGVVSAVHRSNVGFNPIEDFIQTDAAINPGASGGALVDADGNLLGMLSGIFTKGSDANIGVNFAVHTGLLGRVLRDLKNHGKVQRAKSGMVVRALTFSEKGAQSGVRVIRVPTTGAAWRAGLRPDDIIVTMAGRKIRYPKQVSAIVYGYRPGDHIAIDVVRGGKDQRLNLTLSE